MIKFKTLSFIFIAALIFTFTACRDPGSGITDPCADGHDWGDWVVTTAPTCTAAGTEERICSHDSGHTETRDNPDAPALGHDWGEWTVKTDATCTEAGTEERICNHNHAHTETRSNSGAPALGHDWNEWAETTAATATTDGEETRTCKHDSSHTETRVLYATGTAGLNYTLYDNGYIVSRGSVTSGAVHIPAFHRTDDNYSSYLPVTVIVDDAFQNQSGITEVTIPASVTSIGENAFSGTGIFINEPDNSVVYISNWAVGIKGTVSGIISFNPGTVGIADMFADDNSNITEVTIPESVKFIGVWAFRDCTGLGSITFEANSQLEIIGESAFHGTTQIPTTSIPASVKTIGFGAFSDATNLVSVTFGANSQLEIIGESAFHGTTQVPTISIPASVTTVGLNAFYNWTSSQTIIILGHPNQESADAAWGPNWREHCAAIIQYTP